ncbi:nuclear transport factor 2 family protein [Croceicoccus sp. F390]|uniref:Nuclear transport factor 2 family protein n=1 Tax=Croceicoccus esteveae TaxID=3075597 RepID=A0ABU2ZHA1_9SPHN|nr:nuclear transport factor 2 family protein [Croceicoccus sp. F390]MDT0575977.1 nuclear transport factor 2 family protein [Croceicoccus sp. F390]
MPFTGPLEDRVAIRELIDTYADAVTRNDADQWASTWASDAYWTMPDYPEFPPQTGRDNIVAMWTTAMAQYPGMIFQAYCGSIEVDADTADVRAYTSEVYQQDGVTRRDRGEYTDRCVKIDGQWYFQRRSFRNIHRDG